MTVLGTYRLRVAWTNEVDFSGTYDDVTADVVRADNMPWFRCQIGMAAPGERTARSGSLEFELRNDEGNQAGLVGLYSPDNSSSPLYGYLIPGRAVELDVTYDGYTYSLFAGYIVSIEPVPGSWTVRVRCTDGIDPLAQSVVAMPLLTNVRTGEAIASIISEAYVPRAAWSSFVLGFSELDVNACLGATGAGADLDDGEIMLDFVGDMWVPGETTVLQALGDIVNAEWGRLWVNAAGTVQFRSRTWELLNRTPVASVSTGIAGLSVVRTMTDVANRVIVSVTPRELDTTTQVIASLQGTLEVRPRKTEIVNLYYRDAATGAAVSPLSIIQPVAATDYEANTMADGSGRTVTGAISLAVTASSNDVRIAVSNSGGETAYLTKLQLRSSAVLKTYDRVAIVVEDDDSLIAYGRRTLGITLGAATSIADARTIADYLLYLRRDAHSRIDRLILDNISATLYELMLSLEIMDVLTITEDESSLSTDYRVINIAHEVLGAKHQTVLMLENIDTTAYWLLGESGYGELGQATVLGPL